MFRHALAIEPQDGTYEQLARVLALLGRHEEAVEVYVDALQRSPENPELLAQLGLLYLRTGALVLTAWRRDEATRMLGAAHVHTRSPSAFSSTLPTRARRQQPAGVRGAGGRTRAAAKQLPNHPGTRQHRAGRRRP